MALVKCPDCGKMISPSAFACPNCGRPMAKTAANAKKGETVTIQKTSKKSKACGCLGSVLMAIGIFLAIIVSSIEKENNVSLTGGAIACIVFFVSGLGLFVYSKLSKWWNHG